MTTTPRHLLRAGALAAALSLVLTACGTGSDSGETAEPTDTATSADETTSESTTDDHDDEHGEEGHDHDGEASAATENAARTPRVALTYDGGVLVIDASSLEVVADLPLVGFNRLNDAGDGRHVMVSTQGGFATLDTGTWSQAHGDHSHYYTAEPALHDVLVAADKPGHVVVHDDLAALFDDGTGEITVVDVADWTEAVEHGEVDPVRTYTTPEAHHGVAIAEQDGRMLVTQGNDESRNGARILDGADTELAASTECPGVHGETVAGEDVLVVGCEDGVLVAHGDHFHKIASPDAYGRIGNQFGTHDSTIVLGDYKTDPEGTLTSVALVDTEAESIQLVATGAEYTFRGLARGAEGEALVLGTDGSLRVIDPTSGEITTTIPVVEPWSSPEEWQTAHPALKVVDGMAYVTDPARKQLHVVDYVGGTVWKSGDLPAAPNEMVVVTG